VRRQVTVVRAWLVAVVVIVIATFVVTVTVAIEARDAQALAQRLERIERDQCQREADVRLFMLTARHARLVAARAPHVPESVRKENRRAARVYLRLARDFKPQQPCAGS
jgi:hypothetical protein